jgi:16S rRNA (guanine966-N2)-methyltransferase
VRIISGKFKGRQLVSFDQDHIRPTTDRVKESLFNILAPHIDGARVLDLYSGTGNLSLESLSWGAKEVTSVEVNVKSIKIIRQNMELLKVTEGMQVIKEDAISFLNEYYGEGFDLVLIDPPFPSQICLKTLQALSVSPALLDHTTVAIEHSKKEPLPEEVGVLRAIDTRHYGDKLLTFYKKSVRTD